MQIKKNEINKILAIFLFSHLLIWTLVCQLKLVSEMFLPSPLAVFYSLLDMAESGILFEDIFYSYFCNQIYGDFYIPG